MCEWETEKRKDKAEAQITLRHAEEEGFTSEDTEGTEKRNVTEQNCVELS